MIICRITIYTGAELHRNSVPLVTRGASEIKISHSKRGSPARMALMMG